MSDQRAYAISDERRRQQMQAAYEERRKIADQMAYQMGCAIKSCGLGAKEYGKHHWRDNLGYEPDFVVYWRRDKGDPGFRPAVEEVEAKNPWLKEVVWTTGFFLHQHNGKKVRLMAAYPIFRWSLCWAILELYEPRTPDQLEQLRQSRVKNTAERERQEQRLKYPLLYWQENDA